MLTLGMLQRIEDVLGQQSPDPNEFVLSDYFDLIAGTSTGSIIATLLAHGEKVAKIKFFYGNLAPEVFGKPQAQGARKPRFHEAALEAALKKQFGDESIESKKLVTGLLICAKRMDTGAQWAITNHPRSKFYETEGAWRPNKEYELRTLIRASTAAPFYFEPVSVVIADGRSYRKETGMFVDGGVGGDNNPSLQAVKTALLPSYRFHWARGENKLLVVSIGTGWKRATIDLAAYEAMWNWEKAKLALSGLIQDTVQHTLVMMQAMSKPRKPAFINSELTDMRHDLLLDAPLFSFQRYDASLEAAAVERVLGPQTKKEKQQIPRILSALDQIDNADPDNLERLYYLGAEAARPSIPGVNGIELDDFPAAFDLTNWRERVMPPA